MVVDIIQGTLICLASHFQTIRLSIPRSPPNFRPCDRDVKEMSSPIVYVKCNDPVTRKVYYYNRITQEAQWAVPVGVKVTEESEEDSPVDDTYRNYVCVFRRS